jgi:hypothetical protein
MPPIMTARRVKDLYLSVSFSMFTFYIVIPAKAGIFQI